MMIPDPPEIIILLIICVAITGLLKLDTLGEWVWRIRSAGSPAASSERPEASEGRESNDDEVT